MKKLYVIESVRGVVLSTARTKKKASTELNRARRKGSKAVIREYVSK